MTENANLYHEPYQNWAEQSYNHWNEGVYRSNYSQQFKVYYNESADQHNHFKDYKNDYYNNDCFEQEDDWANYTIDENQTFSEAYEEFSLKVNENVDVNHIIK